MLMQIRYVVVVVYVVPIHSFHTQVSSPKFYQCCPYFTAIIHHWSVHSRTELGMFAFSEYLRVSVCCNASKLDRVFM